MVILLLAVLTLGIVGATVYAKAGEYDETGSLKELKSARGLVADWAETLDGRDWIVTGEWTLNCGKACTKAKPGKIDFDLAIAMYRASTEAVAVPTFLWAIAPMAIHSRDSQRQMWI